MIKAYTDYWKGYFDFGGKTTVGGYWWAFLASWLVSIVLGVIGIFVPVIGTVWSILTFIPSLAIMIRRFRDAGKAWYNIFWFLLPLIGWIIIIVLLVKPSKR